MFPNLFAFFFSFFPMAPAATTPAANPSATVQKVQTYYQKVNSLGAKFRQEYENTTVGSKSVSDGTITIAKPGMMRWNYKTPEEKYFISDGTTLWAIDMTNKQAVKQDLKGQLLPVAVTFLYGQGNLSESFKADPCSTKYGDAGDECVDLTPKEPTADYKKLSLVVDPTDGHVKESIILEASDNVNHFWFRDVRNNNSADAASKLYTVDQNALTKTGIHILQNPNTPAQPTP